MGKPRRKKDKTSVIFWIVGIEMLVAAAVLAYFAIRYAAPLASQAFSFLGKSKSQVQSDASQDVSSTTQSLPSDTQAQQIQNSQTNTETVTGDNEAQGSYQNMQTGDVLGEVKLAAVGDNLMHRSSTLSARREDGNYDFTANFEHVSPVFQEADLAIISQDTVIGGEELGISNSEGIFNTVTELAGGLSNAGINIVLAANNHILDEGKTGIENMKNALGSYSNITLLGLNESEPLMYSPVYVEKNGITFALVNYTNYTNESAALESEKYLLNMYGQAWLTDVLSQAREYADFRFMHHSNPAAGSSHAD